MNTPTDAMIDLETFGKKPGCAILSIGATLFNRFSGEIVDTFYVEINQQSCVDTGFTADISTLEWWSQQSDEAQALLERTIGGGGTPIRDAVQALRDWLSPHTQTQSFRGVWANDPTFDVSILEAAFDRFRIGYPWKFWTPRSCRTLVDIGQQFGTDPKRTTPFEGIAHNALDDAKHQTQYVCAILQHLAPKTLES